MKRTSALLAAAALLFTTACGQQPATPTSPSLGADPPGLAADDAGAVEPDASAPVFGTMAVAAPAAAGDTKICGGSVPGGWITLTVDGICGSAGMTQYIGRTIRSLAGMAPGTLVGTCGDMPPGGWVTTAIATSYCAKIANTSYIKRTIKKIEGLPIGAVVKTCGGAVPAGWVATAVDAQPCAAIANTRYTGRTIKRLN